MSGKRTIVIDVPCQVLIHLDPETRKAVRVAILPMEADAGYFGPGTEIAYVMSGDDEVTPAEDDKRLVESIWDAGDWDWSVLPVGTDVEWVA